AGDQAREEPLSYRAQPLLVVELPRVVRTMRGAAMTVDERGAHTRLLIDAPTIAEAKPPVPLLGGSLERLKRHAEPLSVVTTRIVPVGVRLVRRDLLRNEEGSIAHDLPPDFRRHAGPLHPWPEELLQPLQLRQPDRCLELGAAQLEADMA